MRRSKQSCHQKLIMLRLWAPCFQAFSRCPRFGRPGSWSTCSPDAAVLNTIDVAQSWSNQTSPQEHQVVSAEPAGDFWIDIRHLN